MNWISSANKNGVVKMNLKKLISIIMVLIMICSCFSACGDTTASTQTGAEAEKNSDVNFSDDTQNSENESPSNSEAVDIETDGGVVLIGKICFEENEWYFQTEQALNITFEYIMDKPSVFTEQT